MAACIFCAGRNKKMLITLACAMSALVPLPTLLRPSRHHELQIRAIAGQQVRVRLRRPLGIVFEEVVPGEAQGVVVADLVENSNAWKDGRVCVGDKLLKCSAVIFGGQSSLVTVGTGSQFTNWERELVPCTKMDFDTIMSAIESNSGRLGYTDGAPVGLPFRVVGWFGRSPTGACMLQLAPWQSFSSSRGPIAPWSARCRRA